MEITIDRLIPIIDNGVSIRLEKRRFLDYGFPRNHFEILNYVNPADGDLWDVLVFGYNRVFEFGEIFKTNNLVGIIFIEGGNHKLIFKLPYMRSFSQERFDKELKQYMENYMNHGLDIKYIEF